jgi:hypothetical protein
VVIVVGCNPVVAAAQHQGKAVELDLILCIEAELFLGQRRIRIERAAESRGGCVDRIHQIEGRRSDGKFLPIIDLVVLEVETK